MSDLSKLISQILQVSNQTRTLQPNQGALESSGDPNIAQTFQIANSNLNQPNQCALSSGGPNVAKTYQIANSNMIQNQVTFNLGGIVIDNKNYGAYHNRQADFNAKLAAVKKSIVEVRKSTAQLKGSVITLARKAAKLNNWISEQDIPLGDLTAKHCMTLLKAGQSFLEFGQSSVKYGESTVRDSDSISTIPVGQSISRAVFDALTSQLGEMAAMFEVSHARFKESLTRSSSDAAELIRPFDNYQDPGVGELMMDLELGPLGGMCIEIRESVRTVATSLDVFGGSMVAYSKSFAAPDNLITAFNRITEDLEVWMG